MFDEKRFNSDDYQYRQECYRQWIAEKKKSVEKAKTPEIKKQCLFWADLYQQWSKREQELYLKDGDGNE